MPRLEPDTLIDGRYRILTRLGSGGMAEVYMAEDQQLGRRVALKMLHRRFAEDEQFVERFRREASSAAGLSHPNIVAIFDRGEWDGTYYIAMEYVDGRTLKEIVREKGPAPPEAAVDVTLQILRAARYAHQHGVVHRDIKPHNVLIDQDGRVRVTDFGIARAGTSDMTETGSVMGTAQYLSPEQAQGRAVDDRSDLYSIGIVLYELLTGQVPFDAESPVTVALKQVSEPPVPPRELVPTIPPAIDAVVLHAMEKDPDRRWQNADEFIDALETARAEPQRLIPPPVVVEEEHRRSRWWLWLLIALALLAIAVGLYLTLRPEQLDGAGRDRPRVRDRLADPPEPRLRGRRRPGGQPGRRARPRRRAGPAARRRGARGVDGDDHRLERPRRRARPASRGAGAGGGREAAQDAGFKPQVERVFSDDVRSGRVVETSPPAGATLERGSEVTLRVSRGPEQVEVPDVTGDSEENARSALESAGLRVGKITREESGEAAGTVIEQSPAAGQEVDKGGAVDLTVARPTPIPDVVDLTEEEARAELEDAGFEVRVTDQEVTDPAQDGIVLEQSPAADEERRQGSRVTIIVGRVAEATPTPEATTVP